MIISRTPFRISFFGGGTDYPAWYMTHGGAVLATTINKYCYITCRYLPPFFEHRVRVVYSKIEDCQNVDEIKHPAVREVLRYLGIERGVEIHHDGDLPARSGIGSSSTFTVGLLHAVYALKGEMPSKHLLASDGIEIEQSRLKETVGSQDQVMAAYGGFNHIAFHQNGEFTVKPMTLTQERIRELNSHLMLFFTGIKRTASDIAQGYVGSFEEREKEMLAMADLVKEGISVLSNEKDITCFGKLLHEGWKIKQSLSPNVSNPCIDEIYSQAKSAGAIGGKLIGAGGGGFILLFVHPSCRDNVRERLNKLIYVPFDFEFSGSQIIFFDQEEDYSNVEKSQPNCRFHELESASKEKDEFI